MAIPRFLHSWKFYLIVVIIIWLAIIGIVYFAFFSNKGFDVDVNCSEDKYNCEDFTNYDEAERVFRACSTDIHRLDSNGDGIPCEELM